MTTRELLAGTITGVLGKVNYVCNPNEERSLGLVGPCRLADPREVFHMI